ncbi:hypothetical protein D3C81_1439270 [compost metagenome]
MKRYLDNSVECVAYFFIAYHLCELRVALDVAVFRFHGSLLFAGLDHYGSDFSILELLNYLKDSWNGDSRGGGSKAKILQYLKRARRCRVNQKVHDHGAFFRWSCNH